MLVIEAATSAAATAAAAAMTDAVTKASPLLPPSPPPPVAVPTICACEAPKGEHCTRKFSFRSQAKFSFHTTHSRPPALTRDRYCRGIGQLIGPANLRHTAQESACEHAGSCSTACR